MTQTEEQALVIDQLRREVAYWKDEAAYLAEQHEWYEAYLKQFGHQRSVDVLRRLWVEECLRRHPDWEERLRYGDEPEEKEHA